MDDRIVDEYTFGQYMDKEEGRRMLQRHWDSWITEKDFEAISRAGYFLVVRVEESWLMARAVFHKVESRSPADRFLGIRYQWRRTLYPRPARLYEQGFRLGCKT